MDKERNNINFNQLVDENKNIEIEELFSNNINCIFHDSVNTNICDEGLDSQNDSTKLDNDDKKDIYTNNEMLVDIGKSNKENISMSQNIKNIFMNKKIFSILFIRKVLLI